MEVIYPYRVLGGAVGLYVERVIVDGRPPETDVLSLVDTVDLSRLEDWRRAVVEVRAEASAEELRSLGGENTKMTITVHCQSTNTRISTSLTKGTRSGTWRGAIEVDRGLFADRVTMNALLVGTIDGVPNRFLGQSEAVSVWVDERSRPPERGTLPVHWAGFEAADLLVIDPAFRHEPFYVEIDRDPPTIWLNSDFPDLRRLLDDGPRRTKRDEAMRQVQFGAIGMSGWMALFNAAVGAVVAAAKDGPPTWPRWDWQRQVLRLLLPRIYPDVTDDAALEKLVEDDSSEEGARTLQTRAQAAVTQQIKAARTAHRAIVALEEAN